MLGSIMKTILLADDNEFIRKKMTRELNKLGYNTFCVQNGTDAVSFLNMVKTDMAVVDMNLPELNGFQLISYIKEHTSTTKIIATTSNRHVNLDIASRLGADMVLTKPIPAEKFQNAVIQQFNQINELLELFPPPVPQKPKAANTPPLHLLVYTSEYTGKDEDINNVLKDIIRDSKINNRQYNITGLLFYHSRSFVQIIEGQDNDLEELMSILESDPRHKNIIRIVYEPIEKRAFSDWNMSSFDLSDHIDINADKLCTIKEMYKESLKIKTNILVHFYTAMLRAEDLST